MATIGEHSFGREAQHKVDVPNRDLLLEFCSSRSLMVANSVFAGPPHEKVTYHEPWAPPMSAISVEKFTVLDLLLLPRAAVTRVISLCADNSTRFRIESQA